MKEEEERRQHEEELKRLEEERTQQIYMDLKEVQQTVQKREDKEWQESQSQSLKRICSQVLSGLKIVLQAGRQLDLTFSMACYPSTLSVTPLDRSYHYFISFFYMKEEEERRQHEEELKRLEEERTQQIYMDLKEVQQTVQKREDKEWQESLRKSKAADVRRRSIAKQARDDHKRHSLKAVEHGRVAAMSKAFGGGKPLPPKPKPRNNIQRDHMTGRWFKEEQIPLRAGYEKHTERLAPWFHGIISREEAEDLLSSKGQGSFLIRVSEKIMGYVLSYRCQDSFKHFLIDASEDSYCFLGVEQLVHSTLSDLVQYHKVEPITMMGREQLLEPCGQTGNCLDYSDLFQ
ncbi:UNVERIFIED_CONTAM: hypothetical protein FKN15_074665 [Acipenser sinensis]